MTPTVPPIQTQTYRNQTSNCYHQYKNKHTGNTKIDRREDLRFEEEGPTKQTQRQKIEGGGDEEFMNIICFTSSKLGLRVKGEGLVVQTEIKTIQMILNASLKRAIT